MTLIDPDITLDQRSGVPLYEQICQHFRTKIESSELQPGTTLPTNHELRQKLQINYKTAQQAMATLAKEGYVTRAAKRGTVVKGIPRRGVVGIYSHFEVLGHEMEYEYYRLIAKHFCRLLEDHGRVYRMYLGSISAQTPNAACEDLMRHVGNGALCGVLLTTAFPRMEQLMKAARSSRTPVVQLVGGWQADYSVIPDLPGLIRSAANFLGDSGRRRIGVIYSQLTGMLRNGSIITEILRDCGCPGAPQWVVGEEDSEAGGYRAAGRIPLGQLDGLIVTDDVMALGVDRRLHEAGVRVPQELIACTLWNQGSRMRFILPFERFELDVRKQARLGMELLQDAISGRRIVEPHTVMSLVLRTGEKSGAKEADYKNLHTAC